jgi:hypothetical protein
MNYTTCVNKFFFLSLEFYMALVDNLINLLFQRLLEGYLTADISSKGYIVLKMQV